MINKIEKNIIFDDIEEIPTPDTTGVIETQKASQSELTQEVIKSPFNTSMSDAVSGLAATHNNLNKQALLLVASQFQVCEKKLELTRNELDVLRPENAVLKERIKLINRMNHTNNNFNTVGGIILSFGMTLVTGLIPDQKFEIVKPIGWILIILGLILINIASKPIDEDK